MSDDFTLVEIRDYRIKKAFKKQVVESGRRLRWQLDRKNYRRKKGMLLSNIFGRLAQPENETHLNCHPTTISKPSKYP